MIDLSSAISQMGMMLIVVAIGYLAGRLKYLNEHATDGLNKLLMNICLPCLIIGSVAPLEIEHAETQIIVTFILGFIQFTIFMLVSIGCNHLFKTPQDQRALYIFMNICTNTGFLGVPILQTIYGDSTVLAASIFVMMSNLYIGSIGFMILDAYNHKTESGRPSFSLKTLLNTPLIACTFALVIFLLGITFPPIIQNTMEFVGGVCPPVAMLIVGAVLSRANLLKVVTEKRMYGYIVVRQLILPIVSYFILSALYIDPIVIYVYVIMCAAPIGSMVPAFAGIYKHDVELAATGTALSTVCFFVIVPILIVVMALW